jgi:hypothetical protein
MGHGAWLSTVKALPLIQVVQRNFNLKNSGFFNNG